MSRNNEIERENEDCCKNCGWWWGGSFGVVCNCENSEKKDWKLVNFCEFDQYATKSYCAIHGTDESLNLGDITLLDETALEPFNMICGGSPCQDFSIAGEQKGSVWTCEDCGRKYNPLTVHWSKRNKCPCCDSKNIDKTRSSLLVEYLRIIRANKPNFGMYENVKNIVGKKFKETFKMFTDELEEYGYKIHWKVLNAKDYGVPQNRERVYLIFIKKELDNGKFVFPEGFDNGIRLRDVLDEVVEDNFYISKKRMEEIRKYYNNIFDDDFADYVNNPNNRDYHNPQRLGNVYGKHLGTGYAGNVWDENGICPALTTMQGGSRQPYVIDRKVNKIMNINPYGRGINGNVFSNDGIAPIFTTKKREENKILSNLRIRKLTPKECFRLMGFEDSTYEAASKVVSNSQMYKQTGNSIVVDVLYYILVELYTAMPYLFDDLRLSSFFSGIGAFEIALNRLYEGINTGKFTHPQSDVTEVIGIASAVTTRSNDALGRGTRLIVCGNYKKLERSLKNNENNFTRRNDGFTL